MRRHADAARREVLAAQADFRRMLADINKSEDEQGRTRRDVLRDIEHSGGFLANRLNLLIGQDPAKETAKHTREMVRWTKQTAQNTRETARFT
jgi:hypothetical protein